MRTFSSTLVGTIGNVIEHHDKALFSLLAPFIGPLFFKNEELLSTLLATYGVLFIGTLARPLGALLFGAIGDRYGRKQALSLSLLGMAFATFAMGSIPTYTHAGYIAPLLLVTLRLLQNLFSAGESTTAALFILEQAPHDKRPFLCSIFEASTVVGILIASAEAMLFSSLGILDQIWRWPFWLGGLGALVGFWLCINSLESEEFQRAPVERISLKQALQDSWRSLIPLTITSGFSSITYVMAVTFMSGFLLLITPIGKTELHSINTCLLLLDTLLLPFFGWIALRYGKQQVMATAAWAAVFFSVPLFQSLATGSLWVALAVRMAIVVIGVAFSSSYRLWAQEVLPVRQRCRLLNIASSLGHILFEGPAAVIALWLYQKTGWVAAPGLYLAAMGLAAALALRTVKRQRCQLTPAFS